MENNTNFLTPITQLNVELPVTWSRHQNITIRDAVDAFLQTLSPHTCRAYNTAFEIFYTKGLLNPNQSLVQFAKENIDDMLDIIRVNVPGSESTKQARAAAFVSFSGFLQRKTKVIQKAIPNRSHGKPTFKKQRDKSTTQALTTEQMFLFLQALKKINHRDYLVAKMALQGAKRISEVINAKIEHIDWNKSQITFFQLKTKEQERTTIISYPKTFMQELRTFIGDRESDSIFLSRKGTPLNQAHLWRSFATASVDAGLPFRVHPHVLRTSAITSFIERGFSADQIAKVSGHSSLKQVVYYDKTELEKNITKTVSLI